MRAVEPSPTGLRHVEKLSHLVSTGIGGSSAINSPFVRQPASFVTRWRRRTVANGDSITFDVWRCFQ